MIIQNIEAED